MRLLTKWDNHINDIQSHDEKKVFVVQSIDESLWQRGANPIINVKIEIFNSLGHQP